VERKSSRQYRKIPHVIVLEINAGLELCNYRFRVTSTFNIITKNALKKENIAI